MEDGMKNVWNRDMAVNRFNGFCWERNANKVDKVTTPLLYATDAVGLIDSCGEFCVTQDAGG